MKPVNTIRVLILYQGKESGRFLKDAKNYINEQQISSRVAGKIQFHCEKLSEGGDRDFSENIYQKLLEKIQSCDYAVALVTYDKRFASLAGNLWLEIGLWCGIKDPKSIMVLVQDVPDDWNEDLKGPFPVDVPSNIKGQVATRFKNTDALKKSILEFVIRKISKIFEEQIKVAMKKKQDTESSTEDEPDSAGTVYAEKLDKISYSFFQGKKEPEDIEDFLLCNNPEDCQYHKGELYSFSSELLRICKDSWEYDKIFTYLWKIGYWLNSLTDTKNPPDKEKRIYYHQQLIPTLKSLVSWIEGLIKKSDNSDLKVWEKLQMYFEYRILLFAKYEEKFEKKVPKFLHAVSLKKLKDGIGIFTKWAQSYLDNPEQYNIPVPVKKKSLSNPRIEKMDNAKEFTMDMSILLEFFWRKYNDNCLTLIDEELNGVQDKLEMAEKLNTISNKFPHYLNSAIYPRKWHRTAEERQKDNIDFSAL